MVNTPALIPSLNDLEVMRKPVQQRHRLLGVGKHSIPLDETQVIGDESIWHNFSGTLCIGIWIIHGMKLGNFLTRLANKAFCRTTTLYSRFRSRR